MYSKSQSKDYLASQKHSVFCFLMLNKAQYLCMGNMCYSRLKCVCVDVTGWPSLNTWSNLVSLARGQLL